MCGVAMFMAKQSWENRPMGVGEGVRHRHVVDAHTRVPAVGAVHMGYSTTPIRLGWLEFARTVMVGGSDHVHP